MILRIKLLCRLGIEKVGKKDLIRFLYVGILIASFGDKILRPSEDSKITLFRILVPVMTLLLFYTKPIRVYNYILLLIVTLAYSLLASYTSPYSTFSFAAYLNFFTLIPFWWLCIDLREQNDEFFLYNLSRGIVYITLLLCVIQFFFGGVYFNTQNRLPEVNIYFNNGNELGLALSSFVPLYFFLERGRFKKIVVISLIIFLSWHNHARGTFFSVILFLFMYYNVVLFMRYKLLYLAFFVLVSVFSLSFILNFRIFGITVIDFFIEPLKHLVQLDPIKPNIGSITMRVNNIIFGIKEFKDNYLIGIGPDNSRAMVQSHIVYRAFSTQSMHNMVFQIVTEWGILGILFMGYFFRSIYIRIVEKTLPNFLLMFSIFLSLILASSISSGPFVNYAYLFMFYSTILYLPEIITRFNDEYERKG